MEYNTTRNHLAIREYGRHVQKMVEYLLTIEDDEKRQRNAEAVIDLMGMLNPHLRDVEDWQNKLWDHLFLISDFKLNVKTPFPKPTRESLEKNPDPLPYPDQNPKFKHFGKNFGTLMKLAIAEEDPEKKKGLTKYLGHYMKLAYASWHNENVHDDLISKELEDLSNGKLRFDNDDSIPMPDNMFKRSSGGRHRNHSRKNSRGRHKGKNRGR